LTAPPTRWILVESGRVNCPSRCSTSTGRWPTAVRRRRRSCRC